MLAHVCVYLCARATPNVRRGPLGISCYSHISLAVALLLGRWGAVVGGWISIPAVSHVSLDTFLHICLQNMSLHMSLHMSLDISLLMSLHVSPDVCCYTCHYTCPRHMSHVSRHMFRWQTGSLWRHVSIRHDVFGAHGVLAYAQTCMDRCVDMCTDMSMRRSAARPGPMWQSTGHHRVCVQTCV